MTPALPNWLRLVAPIGVGVLLIAAWIVYVDVLKLAPRMLPSPAAIGAELVLRWNIIAADLGITATNALIGLLAGAVLAIVLAAVAAVVRPVDGMLAPLVAAIAVVPIVALTPILNTMFGASSQFGRQTVAAIAAFVP
ncbi:MAG TPA: ABC transporter permease, partial [Rhodoglobus sp.]|nr:ABC transporter permease [Rhodoglobus sp.]